MTDRTHVDATFYVQMEPDWRLSNRDSAAALRGAKAVRMTQTRPNRPQPGTVLVKLTVRTPVNAFLPLRPEAVVVIPEDMTVTTPLEIEASDPERSEQ